MFNTLPTRFRHYEVLELLGGGGFGVVYLARDTNLKRLVVLKTLHVHLAAQPDMVRRFVQEARAMARLDHANIVRVYRVENDPQMPFFEMEYIEGQTLAKYRASQVLSLPQAMPILKQMAAALDAAHQQKIVHRDVKPDNVLIKPDGQLKLTDFGIIKLLEVTGTLHPSTPGIIGTPSYMAPEQADLSRKQEIGPGCDIYALGVMTFELLTGRLPFEGRSYHTILGAHVTQPPPNPRTFNPYLTEPIAQVLLKVLAKQPADRYPSAMAFVDALEQTALDGAPVVPPISNPFAAAATVNNGTARAISQTLAPQGQVAWPMLIGLGLIIVMACIIGLLVRPVIFGTPEPAEPAIVIATDLPAEPTEAPDEPTEAPAEPVPAEPTEAPAEPTEAPAEPTAAPAEPTATSVPSTATAVPPTAVPTLGIDSTIVGQDGMTLLYVPEGEFLRGSKEDEPDAFDDEHPQRSIYLDAFWIDKTEVTNEMFARFVEETGHQTDAEKEGWGWAFTGESWEQTDGAEWRHASPA